MLFRLTWLKFMIRLTRALFRPICSLQFANQCQTPPLLGFVDKMAVGGNHGKRRVQKHPWHCQCLIQWIHYFLNLEGKCGLKKSMSVEIGDKRIVFSWREGIDLWFEVIKLQDQICGITDRGNVPISEALRYRFLMLKDKLQRHFLFDDNSLFGLAIVVFY